MAKPNFANLTFDGAMGSLLLEKSKVDSGHALELLNIEQPEIVAEIHKAYVDAGSDVLYTNTFGANAYKLKGALQEVVSAAIKIARCAKPKYVALDIGPLGKIVGSNGISFDTAVLQFKKIVKAAADKTDFIVIETMTNLAELRAAIIATKECSNRPVIASMSFEKNNRTFFGVSVESFAVAMEALGVSAIGANCAQGPIEMYETAKALVNCTSLPVFIKPNAGMPTFEDGKTIYNISSDEFAAAMERISSLGISMLGGCCGTNPDYISKISALKNSAPNRILPEYKCRVSTSTTVLNFDDFKVVGERINPTGKKKLKCALIEQDYGQIVSIGLEQTREGADILDVNCGLSEIDETATMQKLVDELQTVVTCPLQIDSSNPKTLELALRHYNGRAIVNSVNGDEKSLNAILPVVHKYGACLIALTLDEKGIPKEPSNRLKIAKRIILAAEKCGIKREDIFFDALTLAEASERGNAVTTIKTVKMLSDLGLKTVLGVSNISFGMPNREDINAKFLEMAKAAGLTAAIINPKMLGFVGSDTARDFLEGASGSVEKYIAYATKIPEIKHETTEKLTLNSAILYGQIDASTSLAREAVVSFARTNGENAVATILGSANEIDHMQAIANPSPMSLITTDIIPALLEVGDLYSAGKYFLPQLIASSEAAKAALAIIENSSDKRTASNKRVILASVKGDIHDIGKNIVKSIVSNFGYNVIDLGRDVDYGKLLDAVEKYYPCVLGLSALMTTTAQNMAKSIALVRAKYPDIKVIVGGAVLTKEFATQIGGIYCQDAMETVSQLEKLF